MWTYLKLLFGHYLCMSSLFPTSRTHYSLVQGFVLSGHLINVDGLVRAVYVV